MCFTLSATPVLQGSSHFSACSAVTESQENYPLILTKQWFQPTNAGNLRRYLRQMLLELFVSQAADKEAANVVQAVAESKDIEENDRKAGCRQAELQCRAQYRSTLFQIWAVTN